MGAKAGPSAQLPDGEIRCRLGEIAHFRLTGQLGRMAKHFAPDVVVHFNCTQLGLFSSGTSRGRDAFIASMRRSEIDYEALDGEIVDVLVENGRAAVRWSTCWRHRGTGRVYVIDMAYFLKWRGSEIVELYEYLDYPSPPGIGRDALSTFDRMMRPSGPGLSRKEIVSRVNELANFASARGPDVALIREYYSPEIVCEFVGQRTRIPYAGKHVGVEAVINIVRAINVDFEQLDYELSDILVDGGRLACRRTVHWRHRGTGRRGVVELAEFVKFEDGLIVELIEYRDSVTILEMQGALEVW